MASQRLFRNSYLTELCCRRLGVSTFFWLLTPIAMGQFLINVTGFPMTEELSPKSKGESYRAYPRITSAFSLGTSTVDLSPIK